MKNLNELLGTEPELGCSVAAPGQMKGDLLKGSARGLLGAVGHAAADKALPKAAATSPFAGTQDRFGYLAITQEQVVLVATKPALVGHKAVGVLAREVRSKLARIDLGEGKLGLPMQVVFTDGTSWEIEVPKLKAKEARELIAAL
jgi:hypothetical protein